MYNILALANIAEMKTRRGNANGLIGTILGVNYPLDEAFAVYEWQNTSTVAGDDYEVVAPLVGDPNIGRWHRVENSQFPQVNTDWNAVSGPSAILNKPTIPATQVASDWNAASGPTSILNKPSIPAAQVAVDWSATSGVKAILNKPTFAAVAVTGAYSDLTGKPVLSSVAISGSYADLANKPSIPAAQVNTDWNATAGIGQILNKPTLAAVATSGSYTDLSGKPSFAPVATSGSYSDLTGKPVIPAAQVNSDWLATSGLSQILNKPSLSAVATTGAYSDLSGKPTLSIVATSGNYADLTNKPTIPTGFTFAAPVAKTVAKGSAYQSSTPDKPAIVSITLSSTSTISLTGAANNSANIVIGPTSAVAAGTGNVVGKYANLLGGGLVVGLNLTNTQTNTYTINLPTGWYYAIVPTAGTALVVESAFEQVVG